MHDSTSLTQMAHTISTLNITIYTCMTLLVLHKWHTQSQHLI